MSGTPTAKDVLIRLLHAWNHPTFAPTDYRCKCSRTADLVMTTPAGEEFVSLMAELQTLREGRSMTEEPPK